MSQVNNECCSTATNNWLRPLGQQRTLASTNNAKRMIARLPLMETDTSSCISISSSSTSSLRSQQDETMGVHRQQRSHQSEPRREPEVINLLDCHEVIDLVDSSDDEEPGACEVKVVELSSSSQTNARPTNHATSSASVLRMDASEESTENNQHSMTDPPLTHNIHHLDNVASQCSTKTVEMQRQLEVEKQQLAQKLATIRSTRSILDSTQITDSRQSHRKESQTKQCSTIVTERRRKRDETKQKIQQQLATLVTTTDTHGEKKPRNYEQIDFHYNQLVTVLHGTKGQHQARITDRLSSDPSTVIVRYTACGSYEEVPRDRVVHFGDDIVAHNDNKKRCLRKERLTPHEAQEKTDLRVHLEMNRGTYLSEEEVKKELEKMKKTVEERQNGVNKKSDNGKKLKIENNKKTSKKLLPKTLHNKNIISDCYHSRDSIFNDSKQKINGSQSNRMHEKFCPKKENRSSQNIRYPTTFSRMVDDGRTRYNIHGEAHYCVGSSCFGERYKHKYKNLYQMRRCSDIKNKLYAPYYISKNEIPQLGRGEAKHVQGTTQQY